MTIISKDAHDLKEDEWSQVWTATDDGVEVSKSRSEWSPPRVTRERLFAAHGEYIRGFMSGHKIRLNDEPEAFLKQANTLRRTLVHEALHFLDATAGIDDRQHGALWGVRLLVLTRLFNPNAPV